MQGAGCKQQAVANIKRLPKGCGFWYINNLMKKDKPFFNTISAGPGPGPLARLLPRVFCCFLCLLPVAACSSKPQLNVPFEELQRRLPTEPEKRMGELVLELIALHYKINNSMVSANEILEGQAVPNQVDVAIAVLGYTSTFLGQFADKYEQIIKYARDNERQIAKVQAKFKDLTDREKNSLIFFTTLKDPETEKARREYEAAVAAFVEAALAKAAFIKRNAREMTLGYAFDSQRFEELSAQYSKKQTDVLGVLEQFRDSFEKLLDETSRRIDPNAK